MDREGIAEFCGLGQRGANLSYSGNVSHWQDGRKIKYLWHQTLQSYVVVQPAQCAQYS